jgi:hypothetical protein
MVTRAWIFAIVLPVLAACGGNDGEETSTAETPVGQTVSRVSSTPQPLIPSSGLSTVAAVITPTQLMDWAEASFPDYFPGHQQNVSFAPFTYRYYPATQNYAGVAGDQVYILGPISSGELTSVGTLNDFACRVVGVPNCEPDSGNPVSLSLPSGLNPWTVGWFKDANGNEITLLSTIVAHNVFSPPTPIFALKTTGVEVQNITSDVFSAAPSFYWPRNILSFVHPGTGTTALFFCDQGKEVSTGPPGSADGNNYPDGYWAEQDHLYVMEDGKFVNRSEELPQNIDFSHGCSVGQLDNVPGTDILKNTLGIFNGQPAQQILAWNGSAFANVFNNSVVAAEGAFYTLTGDFAGVGVDDMIIGRLHVRKTSSGWQVLNTLVAPDLQAQGYTLMHGGVVGDFNGDGRPDVVLVFTNGVDLSKGVGLAVFLNDGQGHLIYKQGAIHNLEKSEFSIEIKAIDVNFDGNLDIVVNGGRAGDIGTTNRSTRAVLVNDGSGEFTRENVRDPQLDGMCGGVENWCHDGTYFAKNADGTYQLMISEFVSATRTWVFHTRRVTPSTPLVLTDN